MYTYTCIYHNKRLKHWVDKGVRNSKEGKITSNWTPQVMRPTPYPFCIFCLLANDVWVILIFISDMANSLVTPYFKGLVHSGVKQMLSSSSPSVLHNYEESYSLSPP